MTQLVDSKLVQVGTVRYAPLLPYLGYALTIVGVAYVALAISGNAGYGGCDGGSIVACDAAAYYFLPPDLYTNVRGDGVPAFLYSPAFAFVTTPFRWLTFDAFVWVWFGLHVAALLWLRAGWMLAIPGVNEDVIRGNVGTFVAVAIVIGIRYGAAWTPLLLTKIPTGVGVLWHVARGQWREVAWAAGLTVGIVLVGVIIAPDLWIGWARAVIEVSGSYGGAMDRGLPLPLRIALAVGIVFYAARSDRAWLVPFGVILGGAGISPPSFIKLAALPRLVRR